jgi:cell wall-associated protease
MNQNRLNHIDVKCVSFLVFFLFVFLSTFQSFAQTKIGGYSLSKQQTWQLLDYGQDSVYGASVNRAYKELLKGKASHQVIVAVIDEGVDISHEDLQGHIWTNKREIPGNSIDDDKNGYIDDIHGWNFLGGKDGKNIYATNSEADREYARLLPEFSVMDSALASHEKDYTYFQKVKKEHLKDSVGRDFLAYKLVENVENVIPKLSSADSLLKSAIQKQIIYYKDIDSFESKDSIADKSRKFVLGFYGEIGATNKSISLDSVIAKFKAYLVEFKGDQLLYKGVKSDPLLQRKEIVGDNPFDINDRKYGNNMVGDQYADHGTHCSGIISAIRGNGVGMDGVADNVIILPVRAVNTLHYGDEMDKDIALAIRYAVDNGARIISMSFGKDLSPQKQWVDEAVQYAENKNVLLVHVAGNDNTDIDTTGWFPSPNYLHASGRAGNFINVGAITMDTGYALTAEYSNYGQKEVDIFAPGSRIYSSVPGNKYQFDSGTSMATPVVAGVAALLLEYYPNLTAVQLKYILLKSVTSLKGKLVYKPGTMEKVDFSTLCASGGVVNAYNALQLAAKIASN